MSKAQPTLSITAFSIRRAKSWEWPSSRSATASNLNVAGLIFRS
jgi:hypothetical protein